MFIPIMVGRGRKHNLVASFPLNCPACARKTIHVYGEIIESRTLYFIPIITESRQPVVQCSECRLVRKVPDQQLGEIHSLAEYGAAPFRICARCGTHNSPKAVLCKTCDEVLRQTLFPSKGGARIMAIILTLLFALLLIVSCYSLYVETFG